MIYYIYTFALNANMSDINCLKNQTLMNMQNTVHSGLDGKKTNKQQTVVCVHELEEVERWTVIGSRPEPVVMSQNHQSSEEMLLHHQRMEKKLHSEGQTSFSEGTTSEKQGRKN